MDKEQNHTDLEHLFEQRIQPNISELVGLRDKVRTMWYIGVPLVLLIVFSIWGLAESGGAVLIILVIALIIGLVVVISKGSSAWKKYRAEFKLKVVAEIVKAINPAWSYAPDGLISEQVYHQSNLFRTRYDRYQGDDLVKGVLEKTDFECSELHTQYKEVTTDSKGRRRERWVTIFRGLFFHADFNKDFIGRTYVSPDVAERLFGRLGRKLQKVSGPAPLVVLENVEFEKAFVVHATDPIEARYILTPVIMEAMLNIRRIYNCEVHFSFIGSRVYCALSMNKNLFEPRMFGPLVNLHDVSNMHHLFKVNETIIHELNLNTRIWTKN